MLEVNQEIEIKLAEELRIRNSRLLVPHILLIFFSYLVFRQMHTEVVGAYWPYLLAVTSLGIRYSIMKTNPHRIYGYLIFVALTGLSWGLLYLQVYNYFHLFSIESLYCLGVILTLMAGGVTAFSPSVKTTAVYLFFLSCVPLVILFRDPTPSIHILGILLIGNTLYQFYHAYVSNKFLRESLRNEFLALNQKETLQQFIDSIPGLVTLIDKNQTYTMVNNFQDGYYRKGLLGKTIGSIYPQTKIPGILKEFMASDNETAVHEIKFSENGTDDWYVFNLKKITHPEPGVLVAILPITELVKAKNDLKIQEARTQYAAKLASLGEFSASIAHEVNNPLTIIEGAASLMKVLLKEPTLDMKALEKCSVKVMETTQRIGRIIKSLKMLSGDADAEPFRNVSFRSIVEPSLEISKARLRDENISLRIKSTKDEVDLFGNEVQLSQVIMNLVSNAIDAVKSLPGDKWIEISYVTSLEWVDIFVTDCGTGIPEDIQNKILEPFFTTKDSSHGTGLGLSISNSIVNSHQGFLEYMAEEKHTTFRVRLPRMSTSLTKKSVLLANTGAVQK